MFYTTKYGSEELLGIKTKVSTVKGTTGRRVHTAEALADSEASASLISWDLAKKQATNTWMSAGRVKS